jgi:hypothetical protein
VREGPWLSGNSRYKSSGLAFGLQVVVDRPLNSRSRTSWSTKIVGEPASGAALDDRLVVVLVLVDHPRVTVAVNPGSLHE